MPDTIYRKFIRACYILGILLMIVFVSHSKIMISITQFWMAGTFAMDRYNTRRWQAYFRENPLWKIIPGIIPLSILLLFSSIWKGFKAFFNNKPALIFTSIFLLHIVGLIFTTDFNYASKDLRTKLPILLLPLFIATSPSFNRKYFYGFMLLFAATVLARTFINSWHLAMGHFIDIRDISKPISHVVLALHISLVIFILWYFIIKKRPFPIFLKIVFGILIAWFMTYLILAHSSTGIVITAITAFILAIVFMICTKSMWLKFSLLLFIIASVGFTATYLSRIIHDYYKVNPVNFSKLDKMSPHGHPYINDTLNRQTENGNYLFIYIQVDELKEAWNRRSKIPFDGRDKKNQLIINTLVRYLASKGLRKDEEGMSKLSDNEIREIEKGTANVVFTHNFGIRGEIYEFLWGFDKYLKTGDPTGSSAMQRLEFWRASVGIIKDYWLTGVGTGDMNKAFQIQYDKMKSKLAPDQRWRSHNQFLSIFVGFGIFGFIWFLFAILYPAIVNRGFRDYFFLLFFITVMLSMMTEDTIESQQGVTFFVLFYALLLFGRKEIDRICDPS